MLTARPLGGGHRIGRLELDVVVPASHGEIHHTGCRAQQVDLGLERVDSGIVAPGGRGR